MIKAIALALMLAATSHARQTQPDIVDGCVTVSAINGSLTAFNRIDPGTGAVGTRTFYAVMSNSCAYPVTVAMRAFYFDRRGGQLGSELDVRTIAPNASMEVNHITSLDPMGLALTVRRVDLSIASVTGRAR